MGARDGHQAGAVAVFGITGDLARRMTLPALYRLEQRQMLECSLVGIGSRDQSNEGLIQITREAVEEAGIPVEEEVLTRLASRLVYLRGDVGDPRLYERLAAAIEGCGLPLYYLAIPPGLFEAVVSGLGGSGLPDGARIVIEKPFGHDLGSARICCQPVSSRRRGSTSAPTVSIVPSGSVVCN